MQKAFRVFNKEPPELMMIFNILFVCTGNTCRSPMCEAYFRHLCTNDGKKDNVKVSSAGVFAAEGASASEQAQAVMQEIGLDLSRFHSTVLTEDLLHRADLVIVMTSGHKRHVGILCHEALAKTRLLGEFAADAGGNDIQDPFGGDLAVYRECFCEMKVALDNLFHELNRMIAEKIEKSTSKEKIK